MKKPENMISIKAKNIIYFWTEGLHHLPCSIISENRSIYGKVTLLAHLVWIHLHFTFISNNNMPQLGPEIKTCRRTDPTTSIEGPTFPYTRYDVLPVTEENDGWIPFHTCALSLKSEPNPIVVKRASGRANELTRACRRPHDNALVLCFVLSSPTAICFCRSWRCKRRTEASHRTLLGRALCQASQQMPSLPQQASSCADFPAGHGNPSPSWLPLYHMVGNQDPFLHCLQLLPLYLSIVLDFSTINQYCPIHSEYKYVAMPLLCSADCTLQHHRLRYQRVYRF